MDNILHIQNLLKLKITSNSIQTISVFYHKNNIRYLILNSTVILSFSQVVSPNIRVGWNIVIVQRSLLLVGLVQSRKICIHFLNYNPGWIKCLSRHPRVFAGAKFELRGMCNPNSLKVHEATNIIKRKQVFCLLLAIDLRLT